VCTIPQGSSFSDRPRIAVVEVKGFISTSASDRLRALGNRFAARRDHDCGAAAIEDEHGGSAPRRSSAPS
jgi:hypothetical protein